MRGKVKMLADKGYGFITLEDGSDDVFFHAASLEGVQFSDLKVGDEMSFDVVEGDRGLKAVYVRLEQ